MTVPDASAYAVKWAPAIARVDREAWDALALPAETPFMEWEWLRLLEASGSAVPETGWLPLHLTVWRESRLVAAAPMYVKGNSAGEFIFDQVWAGLATRLGVAYYPKMLGMSPFTPVSGYRFLIDPAENGPALTRAMVAHLDRFGRERGLSGAAFNFCQPEFAQSLEELGYVRWEHQGYVWDNPGYGSFDDFLALFRTSQRKSIRRERRELAAMGVRVRAFAGDEIPESFPAVMHDLYARHNERFGAYSCKYLTPEFFDGVLPAFRSRMLFVAAFREGREAPLALAMLAFKGDQLYGRYWGAYEHIPFLHFELCYYTPIEWAIAHGIRRYDPGMGGEHKMRRGFLSVANASLHRFHDPRMEAVLRRHIGDINSLEREHMAELNQGVPFACRENGSLGD